MQLAIQVSSLVLACLFPHQAVGLSLAVLRHSADSELFGAERIASKNAVIADKRFWTAESDAAKRELTELQQLAGASQAPADAAADLAPTLGLLDGLYEESKERIVALNKQEDKSKAFYADKEKSEEENVAKIKGEFEGRTVPEAMRANETEEENRLLDQSDFFQAYWKRVRARNHKQFHTCLKLQHGVMQRVKAMADTYRSAIAGGTPPPSAEASPEVALLQNQKGGIVQYVKDSLEELDAVFEEMDRWD